jgi:hypothetical protein
MHAKGFAFLSVLVMIIAAPGCDNVAWGGIDVELRPPPPAERAPAVPTLEEPDRVLRELELGPILYLVERSTGSEATLVPVAQITDEGRALMEKATSAVSEVRLGMGNLPSEDLDTMTDLLTQIRVDAGDFPD